MPASTIPYRSIKALKRLACDLQIAADKLSAVDDIRNIYGIDVGMMSDLEPVQSLRTSIFRLPPDLVRDCNITRLSFEDLGPSREYYPNHGRYEPDRLILNVRLLEDPFLIVDPESNCMMNKLDQTFYHELGHGWDDNHGREGLELSLCPEWLSLSGWCQDPVPGRHRIRIRDKGMPELVGEWFFDPGAGFTRFYAKRNPWDDFADSFSYYVGGMKSFLPKNKIDFFDKRLGCYYC